MKQDTRDTLVMSHLYSEPRFNCITRFWPVILQCGVSSKWTVFVSVETLLYKYDNCRVQVSNLLQG